MGFLIETPEALYAAIVTALILFAKSIHPSFKDWWKESGWDRAITAGACFLTAVILWAFTCPLKWLDLPIYQPGCDVEGFIINVPYKAFLAYMLNWGGMESFSWIREKVKSKAASITISWLNSFWFWAFLGIVVLEYVLLQSGLTFYIGLGVVLLSVFFTTILGTITTPSLASQARALSFNVNLFWWGALVIKILLHVLPLPFWLSPVVSIFFTLILFVISNIVFGIKRL